MDISMVLLQAHARPKVREAQGQARSEDGKGIRGIEREEPDPGTPSTCTYVRTLSSCD